MLHTKHNYVESKCRGHHLRLSVECCIIQLIDNQSMLTFGHFFLLSFFFFFFFFQVQPYNRKYRSIGHRVWSMSLMFAISL